MSAPTQFRKKPVVISAIQWTGENLVDVIHFTDGRPPNNKSSPLGKETALCAPSGTNEMSITAIIVADSVSRTYGDSKMNRLGIIAATLSALPAVAAVRMDGYDLATDDGDKTVVITGRQPKAKVRPVLIDRVRAEPAVKSNSLKRLLKQKGRK